MLDKHAKIYVAGHHGLVGTAIWNNLLSRGYTNLVGRSHKDLDLTDQVAVKKFFDEERNRRTKQVQSQTCLKRESSESHECLHSNGRIAFEEGVSQLCLARRRKAIVKALLRA